MVKEKYCSDPINEHADSYILHNDLMYAIKLLAEVTTSTSCLTSNECCTDSTRRTEDEKINQTDVMGNMLPIRIIVVVDLPLIN